MKSKIFVCFILIIILFIYCGGSKKLPKSPSAKDDPRIHCDLAARYLNEQKCQEAANEYKQCLVVMKDIPEAWNYLGMANLCLKDYATAKANFEKALALDPMYTQVHNNLGILYMESNDFGNAEKEFLTLLQEKNVINPAAAYYNLATLYVKKKDYQTALYTAKKCVEMQPREVAPRILYISILTALNRDDEAIIELRALVQNSPRSQEANYDLANLLYKYRKACESRTYFLKVLELNPTNELGKDASEKLKTIQCSENAPETPLPEQKK